jgi:cysteine-rich repeat protein
VAAAKGHPDTETVMQQGSSSDEAQRTLGHDDIATLRYAMSGLDEQAGTADDYTLSLTYAGRTTACDVVIDFDDTATSFGVCDVTGAFISPASLKHVRIESAAVFFNDAFAWFFNAALLPVCGDGALDGQEACDDGNVFTGDGCTAACLLEPGWTCAIASEPCAEVCGDGVVTQTESCDDGNTSGGDCCSASCGFELAADTCTDDGNPCTDDICDGWGTCQHLANASPCDDGDACTSGDACSVGVCKSGELIRCSDGDYCNGLETCDPQSGCVAGELIWECAPQLECVIGGETVMGPQCISVAVPGGGVAARWLLVLVLAWRGRILLTSEAVRLRRSGRRRNRL